MSKKVIIELKNISKKYPKKDVLKDVSKVIYEGDRIAVVGPNGAGKSTISEIVMLVKKPTSGEVIYSDPDIRTGIQFQDSNYPEGVKVKDILYYYMDTYGIDKNDESTNNLIDYFELREFYKTAINSLSGGQKQRLNILLSIIHDPEIVLLDELTTGLDIEAKENMRQVIKDKILDKTKKSLLLVSHSMSEVEDICNRIWVVAKGTIIYDLSVQEVIKKHKSVDAFMWKVMKELRSENESTR